MAKEEEAEHADADDSPLAVIADVAGHSNVVGAALTPAQDEQVIMNGGPQPAISDGEGTEDAQMRAAVSHPMTASTSTSSNPSLKDATTGTASPYGTRSRNRAGASRPNYAEDREADIDFEVQPQKEDDRRKPGRLTEARSTSETTGHSHTARKIPSVENGGQANVPVKDQIPGTSTFSANPSAANPSQPSKKRKAAGPPVQSHTGTALPIITTASSSSQSTTRRGSIAALSALAHRESNMLSFEACGARLSKEGKLVADDGTTLSVNDHVYLVCEPPGEPYYLGRVMEFLHVKNEPEKPIDALRINWYYRPKDIGRKVNDTRQVFASMHSDTSPLTALRGVCQIKHKSEIPNLDEYRKTQNCFWYEKLYDRYIHRYYEVIPTSQIVNVPAIVKRVLDERWRFILVESGRGKELTSAVKSCKRCSGYCASNDSVDCAVCHQTYHMNCVRPPLLKKPSRGFAWACGPCSRAQERKLEARNTPNLADLGADPEEEEVFDEEDEDYLLQGDESGTGRTSPARSVDGDLSVHPGTPEQIYQASLWPYRYLGVHCRVEDALDYDDRIYPRASSRLGPRHQANVTVWHGRPVELVKAAEIKRKYVKGGTHKKDAKLSKETLAAIEADKIARERRPKWVIDEPPGYVPRGEDFANDDPKNTAQLLFKLPETHDQSPVNEQSGGVGPSASARSPEEVVDDYMVRAKEFAGVIGVPEYSVNFIDKALTIYRSVNYDAEAALRELSKVQKKDLKEPELTPAEVKKFEDGVTRFGSELHSVKKHVKTVSPADIVRFYYVWKKSERGKQIWGNYSGRKGKKEAKKVETNALKLQDDVADDHDDSAFDNDKAAEKKRGFQCKFCSTRSSRQWRRAPNTAPGTTISADANSKGAGKDKGPQLMVALCLNCAVVWRKYAVQWEEGEDGKKSGPNGGRVGKRKGDDALTEFQLNESSWTANNTDAPNTPSAGTPVPQAISLSTAQEPARKKAKSSIDKDPIDPGAESSSAMQSKKKVVEKVTGPPPAPEVPRPKTLPCAVCLQMEPLDADQRLSCKECRMAVHRNCYGVVGETRGAGKWICDMCSNDRNPQVSVHYKCTLCPVEYTEQDFVEPMKVSHKKKTDKDREKDRIERETALKTAEFYRKRQEDLGRPVNPREPLKRTANNNWVHVTCAVWTPEVKFGNAEALEPSEGIPSIPAARYEETCKACKKRDDGACVFCHSCRAPVHVECAHQHGYVLGFDVAPVKGSRRDQFNIVTIGGEAGTMTAAVWCKEHSPTKTIVHRMHDIVDNSGLNALQLYVRNFKQADLTLTGTVRKANLVNLSTKVAHAAQVITGPHRRTSTSTVSGNGARPPASATKHEDVPWSGSLENQLLPTLPRDENTSVCVTCGVDVSPKWWPYRSSTLSSSRSDSSALGAPPSAEDDVKFGSNHATPPTSHSSKPNGYPAATQAHDSPKSHVALAVAALDDESPDRTGDTAERQCHKCHHRGVRKPSPPPRPPPPTSLPDRAPPQLPLATRTVATPTLASPLAIHATATYSWPASRTYSPTGPPADWSRPAPITAPPPLPAIHHLNGSRSPHTLTNGHFLVNQPPHRPPVSPITVSPHLNGALPQPVTSSYPNSPHRILGPPHPTQNGPYVSYASTRTAPHHLTNGGPPPRALEHPFPLGTPSLHHHPTSYTSPPMARDPLPTSRDTFSNGQPGRSSDGRVNGGASASPSLQNLLS